MKFEKLSLLKGFQHIDGRGSLKFNNDLKLTNFKRLYFIENSQLVPLRGWHGHEFEAKIFVCLRGSVRVGGIKIDNWENPSKHLRVEAFEITDNTLDAVYVPAGYANAFLSLENGSQVMVISNSSLEESQQDDYRYPSDYWAL